MLFIKMIKRTVFVLLLLTTLAPVNSIAQPIHILQKEIGALINKADALSEKDTTQTKQLLQKALQLNKQVKADSNLVNIYGIYGIMYGSRDMPIQAIQYFTKAYTLLKGKGDGKEMADVLMNISNVQNRLGNNQASLKSAFEALDIYKKINLNKKVGMCLMNIGITYFFMGKYDSSFKYQFDALAIREKEGDKPDLMYSLNVLGTSYLYTKNYKQAEKYLTNSAEIAEQLGADNLAQNSWYNLGELKVNQSEYKQAEEYLRKAMKAATKIGDPRVLRKCYEQLAVIATANNDYKKATEHLAKAVELSKKTNSPYSEISALLSLSDINILEKKYDDAEKNLTKAYDITKANHILLERATVLRSLIKVFSLSNKAEKIEKLYVEYDDVKDSLLNEKSLKQINELQTKYETEKKEAQIKLLNSENYLQKTILGKNKIQLYANKLGLEKQALQLSNQNLLLDNQQLEIKYNQNQIATKNADLKSKEQKISLLGLTNRLSAMQLEKKNTQLLVALATLLGLSLMSYLFYNRYKLKQEARLQNAIIEEQDEAAKAVINAEENERQRMSATLHDGLGQLLSVTKMNLQSVEENTNFDTKTKMVFANAMQLVDASIQEMRYVSHQIVTNNVVRRGLGNALKELIEKMDSNRLRINLDIDGLVQNVETDVQLVLYRIFQESINNVIKHANADTLNIRLKVHGNIINGFVEDNGKGFNTSLLNEGTGIGLNNIATRIKFLKGNYKITSSPGKGTNLQFEIPV